MSELGPIDTITDQSRPDDTRFGHDGPGNHLALIYESQADQFATVVPYIRAGIERGERCLYIVDDNTTAEVIEAMEDSGIDVDAARKTGLLSFHTTDDTYLKDGSFDPEETITYLDGIVTEAVETQGFEHVRMAGEMTWVLDDEHGVDLDALAEYESRINDNFSDRDVTIVCQYSRSRFSADTLRDVVCTHPQLVYEETLHENCFYVSPEQADATTFDGQLKMLCDRTERSETELESGDAACQSYRDRLARLETFNELIRDIVTSVAELSSREAVDEAVCERLAAVDSWQFAWIGETDATSDQVTERSCAGVSESYLNDVTVSVGEDPTTEPAGRTAATRSTTVVDVVPGDGPSRAWQSSAQERGFRSAISIPLVYEDLSYGVMTIYGEDREAFGDLERDVLDDIGRAVAFAYNSIDCRQALVSDRATELDLRLSEETPEFVSLATRTGGSISVEGIVSEDRTAETDAAEPVETDLLRVFFSVRETTRQQIDAVAEGSSLFQTLSLVAERDEELVYDGIVSGDGFLGTLLDHAAVPKSIEPGSGGDGRVVVHLPTPTDVSSFITMLTDRYPGIELFARREIERATQQSRHDVRSRLEADLTDRQWDALQTAYLSGYFEWPRERSGEEVGASLDVSQPTFNRHLRDSLRKLLTPIFDDDSDRE